MAIKRQENVEIIAVDVWMWSFREVIGYKKIRK